MKKIMLVTLVLLALMLLPFPVQAHARPSSSPALPPCQVTGPQLITLPDGSLWKVPAYQLVVPGLNLCTINLLFPVVYTPLPVKMH